MAKRTPSSDATGPPRVVGIFGGDDYLRRRAVADLIDRVLGPQRDQLALSELDGSAMEVSELLDECRTGSLLAPIRLIVVSDAETLLGHRERRPPIERYVESPSDASVLALVGKKLDARWKIAKLLAQAGALINCEPPKPQALPGWIVRHARTAHDAAVEPEAARQLADLVGADLGRLDGELGKLAAFVSPRKTIAPADVEELVGASRMANVFAIVDAAADNNAPAALTVWERVLATDKDAPYRSVAALATGFRRLAEAKRLIAGGASAHEARTELRMWTEPQTLDRQTRRFTLRQWQNHLLRLLAIDVGAKSGLGGVPSAVERFIVELCTARLRAANPGGRG